MSARGGDTRAAACGEKEVGGLAGLVIGTAGHVDHGKTALVRALTGVDTDRWREEKERGLTIDIGFAPLALGGDREVGVVDVPGHRDFLKNMLAGASGVDLLLLAVAGDEGPMPQTVEHLAVASLLGVRRGVVAITKADRADGDWLELVREAAGDEVRRAMAGEEWPAVAVSGVTGEGLDELRAALAREAGRAPGRPTDDLFRLPVDRSFSVHGTGTVVTGTIWSGTVEVGDEVRILPAGRRARVRSLQVHGAARPWVGAGRRCAMALVGLEPSDAPRGSVAVIGGSWEPSERLGVRLRVLPRPARPLEHGQRVRVHHGTGEVMARVLLPGGVPIAPGGTGPGLLKLQTPLVARAGDRFVLRFYSPVATIGGGEVADLRPGRRWRERTAWWAEVLDGDPAAAVRAIVGARGGRGADPEELPLLTGLDPSGTASRRTDPPSGVVEIGGRWFPAEALRAARAALVERLGGLHAGRPRAPFASREALRASVAEAFAPALVDRALQELAAAGEVEADGPGVRLPGHRPRLTAREAELREALLGRLAGGGAEPPTVDELEHALRLDRDVLHDLLDLLERQGRVVPVTPELYLTTEALGDLERLAREVLARLGVAPPAAFKESFGVTRKYLIPVLEHLDRTGVTRRTGEGRVLAG